MLRQRCGPCPQGDSEPLNGLKQESGCSDHLLTMVTPTSGLLKSLGPAAGKPVSR